MKERELGSMQIANERIRVVEKSSDVDKDPQTQFSQGWPPLLDDYLGATVLTEWWAMTEEQKLIGWATLFVTPGIEESVALWACVAEDRRRSGLGKLMIRMGTDQAIRYRKRTIWAEVLATNAAALSILDDEEFEKQPEAHPGFVVLRKELKWTSSNPSLPGSRFSN